MCKGVSQDHIRKVEDIRAPLRQKPPLLYPQLHESDSQALPARFCFPTHIYTVRKIVPNQEPNESGLRVGQKADSFFHLDTVLMLKNIVYAKKKTVSKLRNIHSKIQAEKVLEKIIAVLLRTLQPQLAVYLLIVAGLAPPPACGAHAHSVQPVEHTPTVYISLDKTLLLTNTTIPSHWPPVFVRNQHILFLDRGIGFKDLRPRPCDLGVFYISDTSYTLSNPSFPPALTYKHCFSLGIGVFQISQ